MLLQCNYILIPFVECISDIYEKLKLLQWRILCLKESMEKRWQTVGWILNSGDPFEKIQTGLYLEIKNSDVTEKGLRYDLTVPFARYVVMHRIQTTFLQAIPDPTVWRDRPKRKIPEFYQVWRGCDRQYFAFEWSGIDPNDRRCLMH